MVLLYVAPASMPTIKRAVVPKQNALFYYGHSLRTGPISPRRLTGPTTAHGRLRPRSYAAYPLAKLPSI